MKGEIHETVVRHNKRLEMDRLSLGVTTTDRIRNKCMRMAQAECFGDTVRAARLRRFGHVQKK